ncbi:MAG TPA: DUF3341 domain-containing protein [Terriglobia bacterium]|nr:DUF3341 domain-containing protein [Terriglobia bacterium]
MAENNCVVFGIYPSYASVEGGVEGLKAAGFPNTAISILFPEATGSKDFAFETGTQAPEGAALGAGTGDLTGSDLKWLVGIGVLALSIPCPGSFIASGPIIARLAGADGALSGIAGALTGMGIPEYEAKRYQGWVKEGRILLLVHSNNSGRTARATEILEQTGAQDISSTGEKLEAEAASDAETKVPLAPVVTAGGETADPSRNMAGLGAEGSG